MAIHRHMQVPKEPVEVEAPLRPVGGAIEDVHQPRLAAPDRPPQVQAAAAPARSLDCDSRQELRRVPLAGVEDEPGSGGRCIEGASGRFVISLISLNRRFLRRAMLPGWPEQLVRGDEFDGTASVSSAKGNRRSDNDSCRLSILQTHQLRYFVALAEARHFGAAAERCHIAQPSLSKQIRLLEAELGAMLVQRARGNLQLTPAGEALYVHAKRILSDHAAAREAVAAVTHLEQGRVRIGATPSTATSLVPPVLAQFHARHPGIDIELHEAGSRDLVQLLGRGDLDLALVVTPLHTADPALATTPLLNEDLVLAVRKTHPLAAKNKITVRDLAGIPLVMFRRGYDLRAVVLDECRRANVQPTISIDGGEMNAVLRLAAAGLGAAVVPAMVLFGEPDLVGLPFTRPHLTRTVSIAYRRDVGLYGPTELLHALLIEHVERGRDSRLPQR